MLEMLHLQATLEKKGKLKTEQLTNQSIKAASDGFSVVSMYQFQFNSWFVHEPYIVRTFRNYD